MPAPPRTKSPSRTSQSCVCEFSSPNEQAATGSHIFGRLDSAGEPPEPLFLVEFVTPDPRPKTAPEAFWPTRILATTLRPRPLRYCCMGDPLNPLQLPPPHGWRSPSSAPFSRSACTLHACVCRRRSRYHPMLRAARSRCAPPLRRTFNTASCPLHHLFSSARLRPIRRLVSVKQLLCRRLRQHFHQLFTRGSLGGRELRAQPDVDLAGQLRQESAADFAPRVE